MYFHEKKLLKLPPQRVDLKPLLRTILLNNNRASQLALHIILYGCQDRDFIQDRFMFYNIVIVRLDWH